jgi:C4-dicarboxylate transporter, DctQ subunit
MKFLKAIKRLNRAFATLSGTLILIICIFAVLEVIARTAFNQPTKWSLAFSQFMLLYAIFLGSAYCFQENGHIRVDILLDHLSERPRAILNIIGLSIAAIFVAVLGWQGFETTVMSARFDWLTITTLQIPSAYLYVIICIGSFLMMLSLLTQITESIFILKNNKQEGDGR